MGKKRKPELEQLLEEFRVVLALEEKAAATYLQLAQDCEEGEVQDMLHEIARQELAHVEIARTLLQIASQEG